MTTTTTKTLSSQDLEGILRQYDYYLGESNSVMITVTKEKDSQKVFYHVSNYFESVERFIDKVSKQLTGVTMRKTASNIEKRQTISRYYDLLQQKKTSIFNRCPESVKMELVKQYLY